MADVNRILVVDDDEPIRTLFRVVLRRAGYLVDAAANGREALACLSVQPAYDLVLIDLMMAPGNGFEVIATLEKLENAPRCIVVSAASPLQLARADSKVVCSILQKPVDIRMLTTVVAACLQQPRGFKTDRGLHLSSEQSTR